MGQSTINYTRRVVILLSIFSLYRIIFSIFFELGNDESYYWVYSQYLQWNYFDHPPMVAVLVKLFTGNLSLQSPVFLRIGSIVACALSSWFMFRTVSSLANEKAGWFAVCLYNASFYAGLTAGVLVIPDAPQMIFWTFSLWMIVKVIKDEYDLISWLALGASIGLCIMSKIHGIYLWMGLGAYILFYQRSLLKNKNLYLSIILSLIIISPIFIWNFKNDFITYQFHSERVVIHDHLFNLMNLLREVVAEVFINNPFNVLLFIIVLFILRKTEYIDDRAVKVFNITGALLISIVVFLSLFRDTRAIWSGPGYVSLIPFTAIGAAQGSEKIYTILKRFALLIFLLGGLVLYAMINFKPGTFSKVQGYELGKGDITLDQYGWEAAGKKFAEIYKSEIQSGRARAGTPMVCNTWWGAHDEYYFCRPLGIPMIGLGPVLALHEYAWINTKRLRNLSMETSYCVMHSDEAFNINEAFDAYYSTIEKIANIEVDRKGLPSHLFMVFRLSGWKNKIPVQK